MEIDKIIKFKIAFIFIFIGCSNNEEKKDLELVILSKEFYANCP